MHDLDKSNNDNENFYLKGMERLLSVARDLCRARQIADIQRIVRRAARELARSDGATFVLLEDNQCYYADEDAIAPLWKGKRFPVRMCISGWVMQHREPAVIADIRTDPRVPYEVYRPTFVKSLVMVPIRAEDPLGAIGNYWATPHQSNEYELALLQALAESAAVALENVMRYEEMARLLQERTQALQEAENEIDKMRATPPSLS